MNKENINIVYVDIDKLKFAEYNPRKANKEQIEQVKKSLERFGFVDPVIVNSAENRKNTIIGGHLRVKVAKDIGIKQVPVVYVNIPDIEKEKELNLRLNKNTGDWDFDILANFDVDLLKDVGFDLKKIDIDFDLIEEAEKEEKRNVKIIEFSEDLINFPSSNIYGIPDLIPDLIYNDDIKEIKTIANSKSLLEPSQFYLVNYNKLNYSKNDKRNILSFYCYDYEFETVWRDTAKFVRKLGKYSFEAIISPNWSLFPKDPLALQIWNTFKSRYIARYLQELGYSIIPDLNFSTIESLDITLLGLPKEISYISLQCQNLIASDFENWYKCFKKIIRVLEPKKILLYGGKKVVDIIDRDLIKRCIIIDTINEEIRNVKNKDKIN